MYIDKLILIASELNNEAIISDLKAIQQRRISENVKIVLPLVGEFSAGKTTLINALTDNKQLETALRPTTSTIYEVHFGCEKCYAEVITSNGEIITVDNISELKNDNIRDAVVVNVYDTSNRIPSTAILVDTPGLSSDDIKHRQALVNFMPHADGIILVVDINNQLTRSLTEFVKTIELTKRPVYLVLTRCYSKSAKDIEKTKRYIKENTELDIKEIVCVSSKEDDMQEFYSLMSKIQCDKNNIIKQVDEQRLKNIAKLLLNEINELQSVVNSDSELDHSISNQERDLKKLYKNIDKLISDAEFEISEMERKTIRSFQDAVLNRLNTLVAGKSVNFDAEAVSAINNTSSVIFNDYRCNVKKYLHHKASERVGTEDTITLDSLNTVDLDQFTISGITYNLDLNSIGHQYDGMISTGLKIGAAIAGTVAVGAAAGAAGVGGVAAADMALDVADTVTDIQSIVSNKRTVNRIDNAVKFIGRTGDKLSQINEYNNNVGSQIGCQNGIVESMVGFVTDKTWGKPQRIRAINNYIDSTLLPEFKHELSTISRQIVDFVANAMKNEVNDTISRKTELLNQLKEQKRGQQSEYMQRMAKLNEYKKDLQMI